MAVCRSYPSREKSARFLTADVEQLIRESRAEKEQLSAALRDKQKRVVAADASINKSSQVPTLITYMSVSYSSLFTPALLTTHSFVFFAVRKTRRIFPSPFISKASRWLLDSF